MTNRAISQPSAYPRRSHLLSLLASFQRIPRRLLITSRLSGARCKVLERTGLLLHPSCEFEQDKLRISRTQSLGPLKYHPYNDGKPTAKPRTTPDP
jgi:hypothetical protein